MQPLLGSLVAWGAISLMLGLIVGFLATVATRSRTRTATARTVGAAIVGAALGSAVVRALLLRGAEDDTSRAVLTFLAAVATAVLAVGVVGMISEKYSERRAHHVA